MGGPGERRLLRFSSSIQNLGRANAIFPPIAENPDMYEFDACHGHDHLRNFATYELRGEGGQGVLSGRKQGFALVDTTSYCTDAEPQAFYDPMGISAGWADIYTLDTPCQWVDITGPVDALAAAVGSETPARKGNVMARTRMVVLFDLSAERHALPIGTGNKTERLMGYFTWHADDSPPVNPIGDLFKTQV